MGLHAEVFTGVMMTQKQLDHLKAHPSCPLCVISGQLERSEGLLPEVVTAYRTLKRSLAGVTFQRLSMI